ncbi:MAG: asparagine synthase (glutamine-hydrolyzing) [Gemmatimonadales bacterium]
MCGIYGIFSHTGQLQVDHELIARMATSQRHRGPDSHGLIDDVSAILGVERLRIVDPSERGDQPFRSRPDGNLWLAANGEIYNSNALRRRFPTYPFQSESDIETILPLYLSEGCDGFAALNGKFAAVIWDTTNRRLVLLRDRAGESPLFYARCGEHTIVGSEIQALLHHPAVSRDLDLTALGQFFELGFILEPLTIFRDIKRVQSGTALTIHGRQASVLRYWEAAAVPRKETTTGQATEQLRSLLRAAVSIQTDTALPLGIFTSGGVDSSLLVGLTAELRDPQTIHTLTARFTHESYDEGLFARRVAKKFGTKHTEIMVDDEKLACAFRAVSERIAEPIADPAVLPAHLLAREAADRVRIVLSGEGADELFGGYPTYLGHRCAAGLDRLPPGIVRHLLKLVTLLGPSTKRVPLRFLLKRFLDTHRMMGQERHAAWLGTDARCLLDLPLELPEYPALQSLSGAEDVGRYMLLDYLTYLPDNLLVKIDRTTMLHSLEARAPYLDYSVTEFALSLKHQLKVRGLTTKWILKKVAAELLPNNIAYRRKRGLSVPTADLINGSLRHDVDELLSESRLKTQGLFRTGKVRELLSQHRSGRFNHARPLWALVAYQGWYEHWSHRN